MYLIEALRYTQNSAIAFVGAGGKTTALFKAARELSTIHSPGKFPDPVWVTTSTHLGTWQAGLADHVIRINSLSGIYEFKKMLPGGVTLLVGDEINDRFIGLSSQMMEEVHDLAKRHHFPLLIEADGSASRPLKAPAKHEPAIPKFSEQVVVVAGLIGLGKPLSSDWIHRPEIYAELSGLKSGEEITGDAMVRVLGDPKGGLKNIPPTARKVLLLNQADNIILQSQGRAIADRLQSDYETIIIASLGKESWASVEEHNSVEDKDETHAVIEKIGGIILAAGGSCRFGEPKPLLLWHGQPLIRHVIAAAMNAKLDPIVVVTGSFGEKISDVISDLPVRIVMNSDWMTGVSSSIRVGINALPKNVGGIAFLQADQPQISQALIQELVKDHQKTLSSITAPKINGQRGNPVLFDKKLFPALLKLEGDTGGRALLSHYHAQWITWPDRSQLFDIDTPEDYKKFLEMFPD